MKIELIEEQVNKEDDSIFGFKGLHKIRTKVEVVPSDWKQVLGEQFNELNKLNFWEKP